MGLVARLTPRFSLLTLVLAALTCGAGMLVWQHWAPWEIERQQKIEGADYISSVTFAPDGQSFAIGGVSDRVEVRSLDFQTLLSVPGGWICDGFLADGRWLKLDADQNSFHVSQREIWDVVEGRRVSNITNRGLLVGPLYVSRNRRFVFYSNDKLAVWEAETGRRIADFMNIGSEPCFPGEMFESTRERIRNNAVITVLPCQNLKTFYQGARGPADESAGFLGRALLNSGVDPRVETFRFGVNSYPYGLFVLGCAAPNGLRVATQVRNATVIEVWDGDTLNKIRDVNVEAGFEIHEISPSGNFALIIAGDRTRVIDLSSGAIVSEIPLQPSQKRYEPATFFQKDDWVMSEYTSDDIGHLHQLYDWKHKAVLLSADYLFLRPEEASPDLRLSSREPGKLTSLKDGSTLFEYDSADAEDAHEFKAFAPDSQHMMTHRAGTLYYWRNTRPEAWWGIFWRPYTYLFIAFLAMTVWSIFRRRGTAAPSPQATA